MKNILIVIILVLWSKVALASEDSIIGLHIASSGNNIYESEIRAQKQGMQRALKLIADKMGIIKADFSAVPYNELTKVLMVSNRLNEFKSDGEYRADVNYKFDQLELNKLFLKYGSQEVDDAFYEYLVIPVYKQKRLIALQSDVKNSEWFSAWELFLEKFLKNKMLLLEIPRYAPTVTKANVFDNSFSDYINASTIKRFKGVLLVSCEYFTTREGSSFFNIVTTELTPDLKNVTVTKYALPSPLHSKEYFIKAIEVVLSKYGKASDKTYLSKQNVRDSAYVSEKIAPHKPHEMPTLFAAPVAKPKVAGGIERLSMIANIYSEEEMQNFKTKLAMVQEVAKYNIRTTAEENKYMIDIYTDKPMMELAEGFMTNKLSFLIRNDEYYIFELSAGI